MTWLSFVRLFYEIFRGRPANLAWIQKQGLLAVKIGQVFALRIDFLDRERCEHLAKLYRQAASVPNEDFDALIAKQAGPGFLDNFSSFNRQPFASASVGQVHRATLKSGEEVAVKILKADYLERFKKDIAALRRLTRFVLFFYPILSKVANPLGIIDHIEEYTSTELDLLNELKGQEILAGIYADNQAAFTRSRPRFPKVYREVSSANVLVTDFLSGATLDERLEKGELAYEELLKLFYIHGFYMFGPGIFHGDLHPGNIILQGDELWFIDSSAIGRVDNITRLGLYDFFKALAASDFAGSAKALVSMSQKPLPADKYAGFERKFLELYKDFAGSTVSEVSLTSQMMETIKLGVRSGLEFDRGMFPVIKSLMYLDGMVLRCKPDAVLMTDMRKFIGEFDQVVHQEGATAGK